jgi:hypothetical protein
VTVELLLVVAIVVGPAVLVLIVMSQIERDA